MAQYGPSISQISLSLSIWFQHFKISQLTHKCLLDAIDMGGQQQSTSKMEKWKLSSLSSHEFKSFQLTEKLILDDFW